MNLDCALTGKLSLLGVIFVAVVPELWLAVPSTFIAEEGLTDK
jgi:hypothetical protein